MGQSEKSWGEMSMDERLEETGFDSRRFEVIDLDQYPLDDDFDPYFKDRPSGVYLRGSYPGDEPDPVYDWDAIDLEEKAYQANLEAEAQQLENLDPTLNPRVWRMGKSHRDAKSLHKVIVPLRKRVDIYRKTQTGHRAGKKDRPFTRDRKRRERDRLDLLKG